MFWAVSVLPFLLTGALAGLLWHRAFMTSLALIVVLPPIAWWVAAFILLATDEERGPSVFLGATVAACVGVVTSAVGAAVARFAVRQ